MKCKEYKSNVSCERNFVFYTDRIDLQTYVDFLFLYLQATYKIISKTMLRKNFYYTIYDTNVATEDRILCLLCSFDFLAMFLFISELISIFYPSFRQILKIF